LKVASFYILKINLQHFDDSEFQLTYRRYHYIIQVTSSTNRCVHLLSTNGLAVFFIEGVKYGQMFKEFRCHISRSFKIFWAFDSWPFVCIFILRS